MTGPSRSLLLSAAALLAALPAGASSDDAPLIGSASGVSFSGYDKEKSSDGRRRWALTADSAAPLRAPGAGPKDYTLRTVRILTFEKSGATQAVITAPAADYLGESKTASHAETVTVEAYGTRLSGRQWSWVNASGRDTITFGADVKVRQSAPDNPKADPVFIAARTLTATVEPAGILLTFQGDVRVVRGETLLTCDRLTTRARGSLAPGAAGRAGKDSVERIEAEGGVRLIDKGVVLTGKSAEVLPQKLLYSILGDAEFCEIGDRRVRVKGEAMRYDARSQRISVEPRADSADGRVEAELPPLGSFRDKAAAASGAPARASGKALEILRTPEGNTLVFSGDVRLNDADYQGACERLSVFAKDSGKTPSFKFDTPHDSIKRILAEGDVTLNHKTGTVRCGKAEFFPLQNKVRLTLSPRAESPRDGASIEAHTVVLENDEEKNEDRLTATGAPDGGAPVSITLPPVGILDKTRAGTVVKARTLLVSHPRAGKVGVFEFEHSVQIAGEGLEGSTERLGIEVESAGPGEKASLRRLVAVGDTRLQLDEYAVRTARAEIIPHASLKELRVADDNGMDGSAPLYVRLSRDETAAPGVRPKVTHPPMPAPALGAAGIAAPKTSAKGSPLTLEADEQELIRGEQRTRAFASGSVALRGDGFSCDAANAELLATKRAGAAAFSLDTLVARGGVNARFGERTASAATMELFAALHRVVLSGAPRIDGWASPPGVERKTLEWTQSPADGSTAVRVRDEGRAGMPEGVMRPRIYLPKEAAPDLGRTLKILDKQD